MKTIAVATSVVVAALVTLTAARASAQVGIPEGGEPEHRLHFTLDATATYGIGVYSALGGQLHGVGQRTVWNLGSATGSLDLGLVLGFQDEPQWLQYEVPKHLSNDAQRIHTWVTAGHTFHLGQQRRVGLGAHLFGGWTHVFSQAKVDDPSHGIQSKLADNYGVFNAGAVVKFDYRFSEYVGASVQAAYPFPISPSYVSTLFHVGVGLTAYLK